MNVKKNFKQAMQELTSGPAGATDSEPKESVAVTGEEHKPETQKPQETTILTRAATIGMTTIAASDILEGNIRCAGNVEVLGTVTGDITGTGNVFLSGKMTGNLAGKGLDLKGGDIKGNLDIKGDIKMSEGASVVGNIQALTMTVNGKVQGDITVKGDLVVENKAVIKGKIDAEGITMAKGSALWGEVIIRGADYDKAFKKDEQKSSTMESTKNPPPRNGK